MANENINEQGNRPDFGQIISKAFSLFKDNDKKSKEKLNVLIIGKTGVGKSTLINTIFGSEVAKTGSGSPITQQIHEYKINDDFSIFDSKGLEVADYARIKGELEKFLRERSTQEVNNQIHIAWLCIAESSRRIEEADKEIWQILKQHNIPSMIAITKAERDKDENGEKFSDIVKEQMGVDDRHLQRVRALATEDDDGNTKKKMGITELIDKTYNLMSEGRANAFARKQSYDKELRKKAMKEKAKTIINRYTAGAGAVAASPIPFSDIALLLPTQCAMIVHISSVYELDMSKETAMTLAGAFAGVIGVGFAARTIVGNLAKFIPGIGSIAGGAINATMAVSVTKLMGEAYIAYLDDNFDNIAEAVANLGKDAIKIYFDKVKS